MIFVMVGTHTDGFARLIRAMDQLAADLDEEMVMQIGATPYEPQYARWFRFTSQQEVDELCQRARVIVSHAGAGSIMSALQCEKPVIVLPRLQKYGEHMDNHQVELARALAESHTILTANDVGDLPGQLALAAHFVPRRPDPTCLVQAVKQAVLGDLSR